MIRESKDQSKEKQVEDDFKPDFDVDDVPPLE
jgi:hypothetical protein